MRWLLAFALVFIFSFCDAQRQLVFLQHDQVIARFTEGEYFTCILKNGQKKAGNILSLTDFSMITSASDTIQFMSIRKVENKKMRTRKLGGLGGFMMASGLLYIGLDQVNSLYGSTTGKFDGSYVTALSMAGAGAALLFIRPKYKKIKLGVVMRAVDYRSPYYLLR
ncbi:MAG: hypothetical protein ACKOE6_10455 [Flammeovirgaceae bacterium]